jgi:hypothetical protein
MNDAERSSVLAARVLVGVCEPREELVTDVAQQIHRDGMLGGDGVVEERLRVKPSTYSIARKYVASILPKSST